MVSEGVLLPEPVWTSAWSLASWERTVALECAPLGWKGGKGQLLMEMWSGLGLAAWVVHTAWPWDPWWYTTELGVGKGCWVVALGSDHPCEACEYIFHSTSTLWAHISGMQIFCSAQVILRWTGHLPVLKEPRGQDTCKQFSVKWGWLK